MQLTDYYAERINPYRDTHQLIVPLSDNIEPGEPYDLPPAVWCNVAEVGWSVFFVATPTRSGIHVEVRAFADNDETPLVDCQTFPERGVVDFFLRPEEIENP